MDWAITITNSINVFGPYPDKWGEMLWNQKWGEGSQDLPVSVGKLISNSVTPDSAISSKDMIKVVENTQTVTMETSAEYITDGSGYYRVFARPSTNAEDRDSTTKTEASVISTTYTSGTAGNTNWS